MGFTNASSLTGNFLPVPQAVSNLGVSGAAFTVPDVLTATLVTVTLTANATATFPAVAAGKQFTLVLTQDATGGWTVTWPASVKWPGRTAPTLSGAAHTDVLVFCSPDGVSWLGFVAGQNY